MSQNETIQKVKRGKIDVGQILSTLQSLGYRCEVSGSIIGMSGVSHTFDIVARGNATRIVIEILLPGKEDEYSIRAIAFRTKTYDCSPDLAVMVCPEKASDELKLLLDFHRLAMIESSDTSELCVHLTKLMNDCSQDCVLV
jgi:hypothetical protein